MDEPVDAVEIPLAGGDVTLGVVRVGDTVRRPTAPQSGYVRTVLRHLERVGFDGAPRYLGTDARGRDVLSFVEGETAGRPTPEWVADDRRAASVGALLRRYHDAVAPLGLPPGHVPHRPALPEDAPPLFEPTLVGHRDVTWENTVFRAGRAVALIDFDLARPSHPVEDVANAVQWWGPWMPVEDRPAALRDVDVGTRARAIVDAYGLSVAERALIVPVSVSGTRGTWAGMRWLADNVGGGWARMWYEQGVGDSIRRREAWLRANAAELTRRLTG